MPLKKVGTPQKIKDKASSKKEVEKMEENIKKESNQKKCSKCGKFGCQGDCQDKNNE